MNRKGLSTRIVVGCLIALLTIIGCRVGLVICQPNDVYAYNGTNLVRLHVIANSNTPDDQDLKLRVRDAILAETRELFVDVTDQSEAKQKIADHWLRIQDAALVEVTRAGYGYEIRLEFGSYAFPDREYGDVFLPAGEYEALRVIIGAGKGDNWWCVLFPPLCYLEPAASNPGSDSVITLAPHLEEGDVQIRSRLWERIRRTKAVERFEAWLAANFEFANHLAVPLLKSK
ncbi:MAG TPA: stage II sporulation protein R [Firmicutes bacterium]|nr:stage II sporulation protein R [Bacillota bacterium]